MKPYKSFLFIAFSLAVLLVIPLVFPSGEIEISGIKIRVYNVDYIKSQILQPNQDNNLIARPALAVQDPFQNKTQTGLIADNTRTDSIKLNNELIKTLIAKEVKLVDSEIIIPEKSESKWAELSMKLSRSGMLEKPLRVLYYGDSQIENDRITSVFRKELQKRFGGEGRGLVPIESIYNTANNFIMTSSSNWETRSVNKRSSGKLDLGLLCEAFSLKNNDPGDSITTSWVKIKTIKKELNKGYSVLSIFYKASGNSSININVDDAGKTSKALKSGTSINELRFNLGEIPETVELAFSTSEQLTIYGLNLESPTGIMVDNIALRGHSYPKFSKIDTTRLKQMAQLLNPAFVVFQYGVNVVPNIRTDYSYYKEHLTRELSCLRKILPETPVLLIGVSDMAQKTEGYLHSYPNIENVLAAQVDAALENGCAFWNLYETMGGEGSMIKWVETTPPLGNKDYVHYTSLGAEKVGHLFAQQFLKALDLRQATASLKNEP